MTQLQKNVFVITDDKTEAEMDAEALAKKDLHATKTEPRTVATAQTARLIEPATAELAAPAVAAPKVPVTQEHATILSTPAPQKPANPEVVGVYLDDLTKYGAGLSEQEIIAILENLTAEGKITDNSRIILDPIEFFSENIPKHYNVLSPNDPLYNERKERLDRVISVESRAPISEPLPPASSPSVSSSETKAVQPTEPTVEKPAPAQIKVPVPEKNPSQPVAVAATDVALAVAKMPETAKFPPTATKAEVRAIALNDGSGKRKNYQEQDITQALAIIKEKNGITDNATIVLISPLPILIGPEYAQKNHLITASDPNYPQQLGSIPNSIDFIEYQFANDPLLNTKEPALNATNQESKSPGAKLLEALAKFFSLFPNYLINKIFTPSSLLTVDTNIVKARAGVEGTRTERAKAQALAASGGGNVHAASPTQKETHNLGTSHH